MIVALSRVTDLLTGIWKVSCHAVQTGTTCELSIPFQIPGLHFLHASPHSNSFKKQDVLSKNSVLRQKPRAGIGQSV